MLVSKAIGLVEDSYRNGDEIAIAVFDDESEESSATIYVCFGGCTVKRDNHSILFKDCSIADIGNEDVDEYYGDIKPESYDLLFTIKEEIQEYMIPTRFWKHELKKMIKHKK